MSDLLSNLNPEQQAAVTHEQGPAIVLAGAGSGKTTVLTHRAAWLIQQNKTQAANLALVTFTNKAAGEMRQRVSKLTGQQLRFVGTFHSLAARILRHFGTELGLDQNFSIYDTQDQQTLIKSIIKEKGWSDKDLKPQAIAGAISAAKNQLLTPEKYAARAHGTFQENAAVVYKIYQFELKKHQAVDFDDLLMKTVELLQTKPAALSSLQQSFTHIMVDEYQDTNRAQYLISRYLSMPQRELFVVGDFAQSIYAWRGADYKNMMALKKDFPDLAEYKLERNYRSTQAILDAATQVISQTTAHPVLSLWTDQPSGSKITVYEANDRRDEAYWTIKQIDLLREKLSLNEIAILYRTNAQSRSFEEALVKAAIPYKVIGGQKFYERKEIKDLLSFLRLIINPTDRVSLERMNKSGKRRLAALLSWIEIAGNNNLISQPPVDLLHKIIEITGYTNKLSAKDPDDLSRLENIDELLRVAKQFTTITNFLENVALVQNDSMPDKNDISQTTNQNEWVSLMSLHAAKGLEFSAVFLAGLEEGMLPHSRSQWDMEQLEEERRLMYVGLTRAKRNLFLTFAKQKDFGGGYNMRSRFINDIDKSLLQQIGQSGSSWSGNKSASTWQSTPTVKATDVKRRLILDDDQLDALLDGDLNISEYVNR